MKRNLNRQHMMHYRHASEDLSTDENLGNLSLTIIYICSLVSSIAFAYFTLQLNKYSNVTTRISRTRIGKSLTRRAITLIIRSRK